MPTIKPEISTHFAPIARSWFFDSNDLKKINVRSFSCPNTGEVKAFDVIRREGFDDIMEFVSTEKEKQFQDFAKSLLDALELMSTMTLDRYVCTPDSMTHDSIEFDAH